MKFYNREEEKKLIADELKKKKTFTVVYGRRRIGKTRLVQEALKNIKHTDFFVPRTRRDPALAYFQHQLQEQEGYSPSFATTNEFFEYLFRNVKKPLFFDEISNFKYIDPSAYSLLQNLIDNHDVRIIVTGSYVGVIKKIFTDAKEPLFGRTTCMLHLKPLTVSTTIKMFHDMKYPLKDAIELWCILGGIPRYIELTQGVTKFNDFLTNLMSPGSIFVEEGINVLVQEFGRKWETYFSILEAIGFGARPHEIATCIGTSITTIPKYLEDLERLEMIERCYPILGNKRNVRYQLKDNFFTFWFHMISPNLEKYRSGFSSIPENTIQTYLGIMVERCIKEILIEKYPMSFTAIGPWWSRKGDEIDILAVNEKTKDVLFCECKWRNQKVDWDVVEELKQKANLVDWYNTKRKEQFLVISKSGFTTQCLRQMRNEGIHHWDLKDIDRILHKQHPTKFFAKDYNIKNNAL